MTTFDTEWKTFSLTHVIYPKGDHYGKFLGVFSLLPHCIVVAFFTLTIFVRDIHVISFFVGQLANEALNTILKITYAEGRPEQIPGKPNVNKSYGWPSSHCQFQAFFFTYATLCIVFRLRNVRSKIFCYFLVALNTLSFVFILHSRTYLRYHFLHQCVHGTLFGFLFAGLWFLLINYFVEPFIWPLILKSKLNNWLQLCDIYLPNKRSTHSGHSSQNRKGNGRNKTK